jgi:hypothetical protein
MPDWYWREGLAMVGLTLGKKCFEDQHTFQMLRKSSVGRRSDGFDDG